MSSSEVQAPAFQQLTPGDHGPVVIVASYIFLAISMVVVFTRLITRYQITRKFSADDYLIIASTLLVLCQTIAITVAANKGLGQHQDKVSAADFDDFAKAYYVAQVLSIPALACAKASANLLIMGIRPPKSVMLACKGLLAATSIWATATLFAVIFQCSIPRVWAYNGRCVNQWALYLSNTVWNVSTDIALVVLPFFLMRNVQVSTDKKWVVIGLFGCRIIVPAFAIAGAVSASDYWNASPTDATWYAIKTTLWTQAILNISVITACIPCIKRFLADLSSGLMVANISEPLEMTMKQTSSSDRAHSNKDQSGSFSGLKLFSMSRSKSQHRSRMSTTADDDEKRRHTKLPNFSPGQVGTNTVSTMERSESMKGLTDNVIMHTIDYEVREENRDSVVWDDSQTSIHERPSHHSSQPTSRAEREN